MPRILAISSYVASGHVGLAAIVPALQAMGNEVIAVPTVVLSCHYGHRHVGGVGIDAEGLDRMLDALWRNGSLDDIDAVITGYMPDAEVVSRVAIELDRIAQTGRDILYLCDPVLGDDPGGLYVPDAVAGAIGERLIPFADIVTPNRFELQWLTGEPVGNAREADLAADAIGADLVAATSIPASGDRLANVMSDATEAWQFPGPRLAGVPHGTGDLFAALLLGHRLAGNDNAQSVARAAAGISHVIANSIGQAELALSSSLAGAVSALPAAAEPVA